MDYEYIEPEYIKTAVDLLSEAKIDLCWFKATRKKKGLERRALFTLQQACEKALKAYLFSTLLGFLLSLRKLSREKDRNLYPQAYRLLKKVEGLKKPRRLGHEFKEFFDFIREFDQKFNRGRLNDYMAFLIKERMLKNIVRNKERWATRAAKKLNLPEETVRGVLNSLALSLEHVVETLRDFKYQSSGRHPSGKEPVVCIRDTVKYYLRASSELEKILEKAVEELDLKILEAHLHKIVSALPAHLAETIDIDLIYRLTPNHAAKTMSPLYAIPLFLCLSRYVGSSRYPDAKSVPPEELVSLDYTYRAVKRLVETIDYCINFLTFQGKLLAN